MYATLPAWRGTIFFYILASLFFKLALVLLSFSLNFPEQWNVTTFRSLSIRVLSVAGFRLFRLAFCFTLNFPKPEINTSSPDSRDRLMSSNNISTVSFDFLRVNQFVSVTASIILALVREPDNGIVWTSFLQETPD